MFLPKPTHAQYNYYPQAWNEQSVAMNGTEHAHQQYIQQPYLQPLPSQQAFVMQQSSYVQQRQMATQHQPITMAHQQQQPMTASQATIGQQRQPIAMHHPQQQQPMTAHLQQQQPITMTHQQQQPMTAHPHQQQPMTAHPQQVTGQNGQRVVYHTRGFPTPPPQSPVDQPETPLAQGPSQREAMLCEPITPPPEGTWEDRPTRRLWPNDVSIPQTEVPRVTPEASRVIPEVPRVIPAQSEMTDIHRAFNQEKESRRRVEKENEQLKRKVRKLETLFNPERITFLDGVLDDMIDVSGQQNQAPLHKIATAGNVHLNKIAALFERNNDTSVAALQQTDKEFVLARVRYSLDT